MSAGCQMGYHIPSSPALTLQHRIIFKYNPVKSQAGVARNAALLIKGLLSGDSCAESSSLNWHTQPGQDCGSRITHSEGAGGKQIKFEHLKPDKIIWHHTSGYSY